MVNVKFFLMFCFVFVSSFLFAQDHIILNKFDLFEGGNRVFVRFVISSGSTCNGIKIFRSEDTLAFELIGEIPGVCGSISVPVGYDFIDEYPIFNKRTYYKLELGGYGFTKTKSIDLIDTKSYGFQIRPNPAIGSTTIFFNNEQNDEFTLVLYDFQCAIQQSIKSQTNSFLINLEGKPTGVYVFTISNNSSKNQLVGKFSILQ